MPVALGISTQVERLSLLATLGSDLFTFSFCCKSDFPQSAVDFVSSNSNSSKNLKDKGLYFNTFSVSFRGENFEIILAKNIFEVKFTNFGCRFGNCNNFIESDYNKSMSVEMNMFGIGFIF